jgi:hypothetical protein
LWARVSGHDRSRRGAVRHQKVPVGDLSAPAVARWLGRAAWEAYLLYAQQWVRAGSVLVTWSNTSTYRSRPTGATVLPDRHRGPHP